MELPPSTTPPKKPGIPDLDAKLTQDVPAPEPHRAHTFDDDITRAMNATDAMTVQEFLSTAREREAAEKSFRKNSIQRKWYSLFAILFTVCAIAAFGYALWHYYRLTVPVQESMSVGVFPSTSPIVAGETDIVQTIEAFALDSTLPEDKPLLVPLVIDAQNLVPLSKPDFFAFIGARPTEPFAYVMDSIRLGVMNDGVATTPFLILSVSDPQIASKEFLIAEPSLLSLFSKALGIDPLSQATQIGASFKSTYLYNMPVRMLASANPETGEESPVILYGYASDRVIVITTKPSILKAVYDQLIRQR